jgi:hypothetical protein
MKPLYKFSAIFLFILLAYIITASGQVKAQHRVVTETLIGQFDPASFIRESFTISPDCRRVAYVAQEGYWFFVFVDGKGGRGYSAIAEGTITFSPDSRQVAYASRLSDKDVVVVDGKERDAPGAATGLIFSPDSKRLAYLAKVENNWLVVIDDKEEGPFNSIRNASRVVFSPDSRHVAYGAQLSNRWFVVRDGKKQEEYDDIGEIVFSRDSKHIAYEVQQGDKWFIVFDGKEGKKYDGIAKGSLKFSPDSNQVAYLARIGDKVFAVVNEKEDKKYTSAGALTFSLDGRRMAYADQRGDKWLMVVDGKDQTEYDAIGGFAFSDDGKRMAYAVQRGEKWFIVIDEKEEKEHDGVGTFNFSPDAERVAYAALQRNRWFVVVDGKEGKKYDDVRTGGQITFDSPSDLRYIGLKDNKIYRVEEAIKLDSTTATPYDTNNPDTVQDETPDGNIWAIKNKFPIDGFLNITWGMGADSALSIMLKKDSIETIAPPSIFDETLDSTEQVLWFKGGKFLRQQVDAWRLLFRENQFISGTAMEVATGPYKVRQWIDRLSIGYGNPSDTFYPTINGKTTGEEVANWYFPTTSGGQTTITCITEPITLQGRQVWLVRIIFSKTK